MELRRARSPAEWIQEIRQKTGKDPALIEIVVRHYALDLDDIHGVPHWLRVYDNGIRLAAHTGADTGIIAWFALFHDSCRRSNGFDPRHGPRAADFARQHRARIDLDDPSFDLVTRAIACHTIGCPADAHPAVRTCLDADRLDIGRVGLRINPRLLFTDAAREEVRRLYAGGGERGPDGRRDEGPDGREGDRRDRRGRP